MIISFQDEPPSIFSESVRILTKEAQMSCSHAYRFRILRDSWGFSGQDKMNNPWTSLFMSPSCKLNTTRSSPSRHHQLPRPPHLAPSDVKDLRPLTLKPWAKPPWGRNRFQQHLFTSLEALSWTPAADWNLASRVFRYVSPYLPQRMLDECPDLDAAGNLLLFCRRRRNRKSPEVSDESFSMCSYSQSAW